MSQIHPTAIVDPQAELGRDVKIGPYCVVGPGVVLGDACELIGQVTLLGPAEFGMCNTFYPYCVLGAAPQDLKYKGGPTRLLVGSHNVFREHVTAHRGTEVDRRSQGITRIGDHNLLMIGVHVAHDTDLGSHVSAGQSRADRRARAHRGPRRGGRRFRHAPLRDDRPRRLRGRHDAHGARCAAVHEGYGLHPDGAGREHRRPAALADPGGVDQGHQGRGPAAFRAAPGAFAAVHRRRPERNRKHRSEPGRARGAIWSHSCAASWRWGCSAGREHERSDVATDRQWFYQRSDGHAYGPDGAQEPSESGASVRSGELA